MTGAIPATRLGDSLVVSLRGNLEDSAVLRLEKEAWSWVADTGINGVLVDASGLDVVDSFIARALARFVTTFRILGAETVVVGIQPAVAITLVELGLPMGQVHTALTAGRGLALLRRLSR